MKNILKILFVFFIGSSTFGQIEKDSLGFYVNGPTVSIEADPVDFHVNGPMISVVKIAPRYCGCVSHYDYFEPLDFLENIALERDTNYFDISNFQANVYPNPTSSSATISIDIEQEGVFEISLYDMSGKLIQAVYAGELIEGQRLFRLELEDQEDGMYLLSIISTDQAELLKIQKF